MFFNTANNKNKTGLNIVYQLSRTVKHFIDRFDFERESLHANKRAIQ